MIYLLEIDAYDPAASAVTTLRYGSVGYVTAPTDTPANAYYAPRVSQPGTYERAMYGNGTTGGAPAVSAGVVELVNADGGLDGLLSLAFDGRAIRVYALASDAAPFGSRQLVFAGLLDQAEVSWLKVSFAIRDRLQALQQPIQTAMYAGTTNAGGLNEAEGQATDLKGLPKPLAYGRVLNVPLVTANAYDLIYQGSSAAVASVDAVYDRGVALTKGAAFTTIATLRAATVATGSYAYMLSPFMVRLGSQPAGQVTSDFTEGATVAARTAGQVVQRILTTRAGLVAGVDFLPADIAALDAAAPAEVGVWVGTDATPMLDVVARVLDSVGGYIVPDRLGVFRIGRFAAPTGTPVASLSAVEVLDDGAAVERLATNDDTRGIPVWRASLNYARNYTVQETQALAGAVTESRRAFLAKEYRTAVSENAATRTVYLLSPEITLDTQLLTEADASTEAARRRALFGVRRDLINVRVDASVGVGVDLGKPVLLTLNRLGFDAGKVFTVLGLTEDFATGTTTLELWG